MRAAACSPAWDSWITARQRPPMLSTLTLRLLEQFSHLWKRAMFCCSAVSPSPHLGCMAVSSSTAHQHCPRAGRKEGQQLTADRRALLCALSLLCSVARLVQCLTGGVCKKQRKEMHPRLQSHCGAPLAAPQPGSSTAASHHTVLLFISDIWGADQDDGAPRVLVQLPG